MRYQTPQFIEIESKIFGPLTLKQFIYLVGGIGIIFLLYIVLPIWLVFLAGLPVGAFSLALAFYKVNNQPFIKVVENAFKYLSSARLYLWKKTPAKPAPKKELEKPAGQSLPARGLQAGGPLGGAQLYIPKITKSKLKDLAWSLDIQEKIK